MVLWTWEFYASPDSVLKLSIRDHPLLLLLQSFVSENRFASMTAIAHPLRAQLQGWTPRRAKGGDCVYVIKTPNLSNNVGL